MSNFSNLIKKWFVYAPPISYDFVLEENNTNSNVNPSPDSFLPDHNIYSNLNKNYTYLQVQYNTLINSDIIMRPFKIDIAGKTYSALFLGIDGMISSSLVNNFLLRPLMKTKSSSRSSQTKTGVKYTKYKKVNVEN